MLVPFHGPLKRACSSDHAYLQLTFAVVSSEYHDAIVEAEKTSSQLQTQLIKMTSRLGAGRASGNAASADALISRSTDINGLIADIAQAHAQQRTQGAHGIANSSGAVSDLSAVPGRQVQPPARKNAYETVGVLLEAFTSPQVFLLELSDYYSRLAKRMPPIAPRLRASITVIVSSIWFDTVVVLIVSVNLVLLCLNRFSPSPNLALALIHGNYVICILFVAEILLRWASQGAMYFATLSNLAEFSVMLISVCDALVELTDAVSVYPHLYILRIVRALRLIRLARISNECMRVLGRISSAIPEAFASLVLLCVFTVIAAILGMQV